MMAESVNYHLHLTNDSSEKFKNWREAMNGTGRSNMVIIDEVLAKKERTVISAILPDGLTASDTWLRELA